jgi:hypothetical protein
MIQIPVFNDTAADFDQKITLGTQELIIRLAWNSRAQFWFMDLDDQQGHVIRSRKVVPLLPLFRSHRALMPIVGDFVLMIESEAAPEYPTFEGLGTTHTLNWLDATELEQWETALGIR